VFGSFPILDLVVEVKEFTDDGVNEFILTNGGCSWGVCHIQIPVIHPIGT
jgi:hypothetical protein